MTVTGDFCRAVTRGAHGVREKRDFVGAERLHEEVSVHDAQGAESDDGDVFNRLEVFGHIFCEYLHTGTVVDGRHISQFQKIVGGAEKVVRTSSRPVISENCLLDGVCPQVIDLALFFLCFGDLLHACGKSLNSRSGRRDILREIL